MNLRCAQQFVLCGVVAITMATIGVLCTHQSLDRVYSVAEARAALMRSPQQWVGRSLYVLGRLDVCPSKPARCALWQPRLFSPARASGSGALPVQQTTSTPWLQTLHQAPVLSALIPAPRPVTWGVIATYHVRVSALPIAKCFTYLCEPSTGYDAFSCDARACYAAVVSV